MRIGSWVGAVCVAISIAASAAAAPTDIDRYLLAARGFYERLEYERALEQLNRAKTLPHGPDDDVTISLYEGILEWELNHPDEAANSFRAALYLRPDSQLPLKVSPKVQEAFEATRLQVNRELAKASSAVAQPKLAKPAPESQPGVDIGRPTKSTPPPQYRLSFLIGTLDFISVGASGSYRIADRWSVGGETYVHIANANDFVIAMAQGRFFVLGDFDHGGFVEAELGIESTTQNASQAQTTVLAVGALAGYRVSLAVGLTFEARAGVDVTTATHTVLPVLTLGVGWSLLRKLH